MVCSRLLVTDPAVIPLGPYLTKTAKKLLSRAPPAGTSCSDAGSVVFACPLVLGNIRMAAGQFMYSRADMRTNRVHSLI